MKLTNEERMDIGRRMYEKEISYKEVMSQYGVSESLAHKCMTDYKRSKSIPVQNKPHPVNRSNVVKAIGVEGEFLDTEAYMAMTKEELIDELIRAKVNEARAKKGYEVRGVGANKEYISLNNRTSKS